MNKVYSISLLLFALSFSLYGNTSDTVVTNRHPTYIQLQYAGNMGLVSVGAGKSFFSEKLSTCLIYGYLPGHLNNVTVHTVALKTTFLYVNKSLNSKTNIGGYLGASLLCGFTRNTFVQLPEYYPKGYYLSNAFHVALFTGAKHTRLIEQNKWFEKISLFAELGTLDYILWYSIKTRYIDIFDIWNISFGVMLNISKKK